MKKYLNLFVITIVLSFLSSNSAFSQQNIENKINNSKFNDSLILIDLNKFYTNKTINLISNGEGYAATDHIIMAFAVKGDSLIIANNDNKKFLLLNLSTLSLTELSSYPQFINYPVCRMKLVRDSIICSDDDNVFLFDLRTKKSIFMDKMEFCRSDSYYIWVQNESDFLYRKKFPNVPIFNKYLSGSGGYDFVENLDSRKGIFLFANNYSDGVTLYESIDDSVVLKNKIEIPNNDMSVYEDVEILFSSESEIKFILKTYYNTKNDDILVSYDMNKNQVKNVLSLSSYFLEDAFVVFPGILPAGCSYVYQKGIIYRLRTTLRGVCIEKWKVDW